MDIPGTYHCYIRIHPPIRLLSSSNPSIILYDDSLSKPFPLISTPDPLLYAVSPRSPYYNEGFRECKFEMEGGKVIRFYGAWSEPYEKLIQVGSEEDSKDLEGIYENENYEGFDKSPWNTVEISRKMNGILYWKNAAGIMWSLKQSSTNLPPSSFNHPSSFPSPPPNHISTSSSSFLPSSALPPPNLSSSIVPPLSSSSVHPPLSFLPPLPSSLGLGEAVTTFTYDVGPECPFFKINFSKCRFQINRNKVWLIGPNDEIYWKRKTLERVPSYSRPSSRPSTVNSFSNLPPNPPNPSTPLPPPNRSISIPPPSSSLISLPASATFKEGGGIGGERARGRSDGCEREIGGNGVGERKTFGGKEFGEGEIKDQGSKEEDGERKTAEARKGWKYSLTASSYDLILTSVSYPFSSKVQENGRGAGRENRSESRNNDEEMREVMNEEEEAGRQNHLDGREKEEKIEKKHNGRDNEEPEKKKEEERKSEDETTKNNNNNKMGITLTSFYQSQSLPLEGSKEKEESVKRQVVGQRSMETGERKKKINDVGLKAPECERDDKMLENVEGHYYCVTSNIKCDQDFDENKEWNFVTIKCEEDGNFYWNNRAGRSWILIKQPISNIPPPTTSSISFSQSSSSSFSPILPYTVNDSCPFFEKGFKGGNFYIEKGRLMVSGYNGRVFRRMEKEEEGCKLI